MNKFTLTVYRLIWLCAFGAGLYWVSGPLPFGTCGGMGLRGVAGFWTQSTVVYWVVLTLFMAFFFVTLMLAERVAGRAMPSRSARVLFAAVWGAQYGAAGLGLFAAVCDGLGVWVEVGVRQTGERVSASVLPSLVVWVGGTGGASLVLFALSKKLSWQSLQKRTEAVLHVCVPAVVLAAAVIQVAGAYGDKASTWFLVRGSYTGLVLGFFAYLWISRVALTRRSSVSRGNPEDGAMPVVERAANQ